MIINPTFTPPVFGTTGDEYNVGDSDTAYFDVELSGLMSDAAEVKMKIPAGADVDAWTLTGPEKTVRWKPAAATALAVAGTWKPAVSVGALDISISGSNPATISATSLSLATAPLRIRVTKIRTSGPTATAKFVAGFGAETWRVVADPKIVGPLGPTANTIAERVDQKLAGDPEVAFLQANTPPDPFGGVTGIPPVAGEWTRTDDDLVFELLPIGTTPTAMFRAPCVYDKEVVGFKFTAFYDFNGDNVFDSGAPDPEPDNSETVSVTIEPLQHRMVLVLDRSGSMSEQLPGSKPGDPNKWDATILAAHAWIDLFSAFRASSGGIPHHAGVLTFEHGTCGYGSSAAAGEITLRNPKSGSIQNLPLPLLTTLDLDVLELGKPQTCTPIGDALVATLADLTGGFGPLDTCTLVLLTDGHENSGKVKFGPGPLPPGTSPLSLGSVPSDKLTVFAIGAGAGVDEAALAALPALGTAPGPLPPDPNDPPPVDKAHPGYFAMATRISELLPFFGQMLGHSVDAQDVHAVLDGPKTAATFTVSSNERRLVVIVPWSTTSTLEIAHSDPGANNWIVLPASPGVKITNRQKHGIAIVDLSTFDAQDWRVQRLVGGAPKQLDGALAMVDLHLRASISFDKNSYGTGDTIVVTCKLLAGSTRVRGAKVVAGPDVPELGLGTYISTHAEKYGPIPVGQLGESRLAKAVHSTSKGGDRHLPNAGLLHYFLEIDGIEVLPRGPGIFEDGTDELFDDGAHADGDADDGVYANRFIPKVEGTYTFRFSADGTLPDGSRFRRVITVSTFVGVKVDPASSPVSIIDVASHEGTIGRQISLTPRDKFGGYLGPFHEDLVQMKASAGTFTGPIESRVDGSYARTLEFKRGETPRVEVTVGDVTVAVLKDLERPRTTKPR
jgi:hypothetical protein